MERTLEELVKTCTRRGFEACLHNEVGTEIATEESISRALESSAVSLCLDTGHLVAAGGDPLAVLNAWRDRVSHIHLKDARVPIGVSYDDAGKLWDDDIFELGSGSGRVEDVLTSLRNNQYSGWIVVEQDVLPRGKIAYDVRGRIKLRTVSTCATAAGDPYARWDLRAWRGRGLDVEVLRDPSGAGSAVTLL